MVRAGVLALDGLRDQSWYSLRQTASGGWREHLTAALLNLQGGQQEDGAGLFTVRYGGRTQDNGQELKHEKFRVDISKPFSQ